MKGRPIDQLVYEYMFPRPKASDPTNFQAILSRFLIYEVRQEVQSFYGHLNDQEAKYPGLDYCHPTHRLRLSRWQWHRRLFRAFDGLRLTPAEIAGLTKWEGTKWAKERFEKEQGIIIRDTTADDLPRWIEPEDRITPLTQSTREESQETEEQVEDEAMDADDSDDELRSVGVPLNERLRERVAARHAGDTSVPLDEDWEQWLKNAIETGEFPLVADQIASMSTNPAPMTPDELFPPRLVEAARQGNWHEVPEFLHDMLRRSLGLADPTSEVSQTSAAASITNAQTPVRPFNPENGYRAWRRAFSDLRLPSSDRASATAPSDLRVQRIARAPGA